jgi:hypothetical protein
MCRIGLIVEYSRMKVPSLSSGCDIAPFFVRHTWDNERPSFVVIDAKRRFWTVGRTFQNAFPGEALFKGVSTRFGLQIVEKCFPGKRILKRWFGLPKSSFGEHKLIDGDCIAC